MLTTLFFKYVCNTNAAFLSITSLSLKTKRFSCFFISNGSTKPNLSKFSGVAYTACFVGISLFLAYPARTVIVSFLYPFGGRSSRSIIRTVCPLRRVVIVNARKALVLRVDHILMKCNVVEMSWWLGWVSGVGVGVGTIDWTQGVTYVVSNVYKLR